MDKKKVFSFKGFPDHLAPDEIKNKDEFGLQMAKAIEQEWFYRPDSGNCSYYDKRDKYHKLRLYARGEQDTSIYKNLMNGGEDTSYTNYDWRPLQIIPKFVKLITNQMTERLFDVKAEATDKFSTDLKDTHKKNLEDLIYAKPAIEAAQKALGVNLSPQNMEDYPDTQEEVDLFMKLKYKPAIEIAAEEAIKFTLDLNDYDESQSRVIEDITTIGLGAIKHTTDPSKGIMVEYVDPADMVYSYPKHRDFKDVHYYGEVKRITINELMRISGKTFNKEELEKLSKSTSDWARYQGNNSNNQNTNDGDMKNMMVDVLFFNFKSTNTLSYKKKYTKSGGYKMTKKESTFSKKDSKYTGYDVSKKVIDVWYEGGLVLGTNHLFNYKLCENMIRQEGFLNRTSPNYLVYAPELYQNRTKGLVERIIPYVDQMQQIHIKLQQIIAKARPNGIYIDVAGLNEIDMGEGNVLTPLEAIKIYDETGNIIGTSLTHEGDYNYGREPIKELKNGVIDGLDRLISAYNHYLNLLRDAIGVPQGADASTPHPDMAVGVQNNLANNSNTATRHILDGALHITERLGKGLALRIKDIFEYSDLKNTYINAIGKINVKVLEALKKYHLHDLGINIELKPDMEEKQYLEGNIAQALAKDLITLDDAIDIRNIGNIKLANELLKTRRIRREKTKRNQEIQMEEKRAETQERAVQASAQSKQQELQAKIQADLAVIQAKSQAKMQELEKEAQVKSQLMEKEFNFNMMLQGQQVKNMNDKEKYKEDRKDKRQDRNNSQASQLIQQRNFNEPAKRFESSEDNLSGSVELSELEPS
jgi:hypothetical protein